MCEWNEQGPHSHVDPEITMFVRHIQKNEGSCNACFTTGNNDKGRPVKSKTAFQEIGELCLDFTFHV